MRLIQRGYSLIELIVYIAVFALLSIIIVRSLITVMRTYASGARYRALQTNGELVMERVTRELRAGVLATTSSCGTPLGTLSIASVDASNVTHTNAFGVASGVVQLTTDGGSAQGISTSEVMATVLTFCPITTKVGTAVKVTLSLTTTGAHPTTASFYSTIVLRGK